MPANPQTFATPPAHDVISENEFGRLRVRNTFWWHKIVLGSIMVHIRVNVPLKEKESPFHWERRRSPIPLGEEKESPSLGRGEGVSFP